MSDSSTQSRRSGGSNDRGGQRRRSRGGRNNRGGNRGGNRSGNRGDSRGGQQGRRSGGPRRQPKPAPLTWWQKFLKAIGLYNPDKATKRTSPSRVPKPQEPAKKAPKSGTRVAKTGGGDAKRRESRPEDVETNRIYVGNLSYEATEYDLEDLFKGIGAVNNIEIVYNRNTHKSKGYGFIEMRTVDDAKRAVEVLHDQPFMGRELIVNGAKSSGPADRDDGERRNNERDPDAGNSGDDGGDGGDSEEAA